MEKYLLVSNDDNSIIDVCHASSKAQAHNYFIVHKGWVGDYEIMSETEYKAELELNQLENQ